MAAINLSDLKFQASHLAVDFSDQSAFIRKLHDILSDYSNKTINDSKITKNVSLPTYRTPLPVIRVIERELTRFAEQYPQKGVILVKALWEDGTLESRILAADLLGMIPPNEALHLLSKLPEWLSASSDLVIQQALLNQSLLRIRHENLVAFTSLLDDWLSSRKNIVQIWGMRAILPLLEDKTFSNLPVAFRILRPAFLSVIPASQTEFRDCLIALEIISFKETKMYLVELLNQTPSASFQRILKRVLPSFSQQMQDAIIPVLREVTVN